MTDADYDELVEGTIEEVKEKVEEEDLDLEKVIEAEKQNKDRVTLKDWLEEQIEEGGEEEAEVSQDKGGALSVLADAITDRLFITGLVIGLAIAVVFSSGMVLDGGLSPSEAGDKIETYFSQNSEGVPLESVTVDSVERLPDSDLYTVSMTLSAEFMNRTVDQNQTAVVTPNVRYMFLSQPIDTDRPLAEQLQGTQGTQG